MGARWTCERGAVHSYSPRPSALQQVTRPRQRGVQCCHASLDTSQGFENLLHCHQEVSGQLGLLLVTLSLYIYKLDARSINQEALVDDRTGH